MTARRRAARVTGLLRRALPDARCSLVHRDAWELLAATILSAQCTDERVNRITPALFRRFPTPRATAQADIPSLESLIRSAGFFRAKAKSLLGCARALVKSHGGRVPRDMASLVALPGVGRKTANVVLGTAFGIASGIAVDTHVGRLARRLGLTRERDPVKVEADLMGLLPRGDWIAFSHLLIHHGRRTCRAVIPDCAGCVLRRLCPSAGKAWAVQRRGLQSA